MAGVVVTAAVTKSGLVSDDLVEELADNGLELVVVHSATACGPCLANEDPYNVPCVGCIGNVAGHHPDSANAQRVGNLCQCRVEVREKREGRRD